MIQDVLSEGAGGSVYKADEQLPLGVVRPVALKVLPVIAEGDRKSEQRFEAELKLGVALAGRPGVVTVLAAGLTDRLPWIAMEYVPTALSQVLTEQPMPPEAVVKMLRQVAAGLAALHGQTPPVLHNDLTPSNILITEQGEHKISDFWLASPANVERTRGLATVKYAAPESLSRELGALAPATDLYALGHIAYEMALGGRLYRQQFPAVYGPRSHAKEQTPAKWMAWHCSMAMLVAPPQDVVPNFPAELGRVIAKLMRKDASHRYASVEAMLAELDRALEPMAPLPVSAPAPAPALPASPAAAFKTALAPASAPAPAAAMGAPLLGQPPMDEMIEEPRAPQRLAPPLRSSPPAPGAGADAGERLYVRLGGKVSGPFDFSVLQQQAKRGLLSKLHQVSADRMSWRSAGSVDGLFRVPGEEEM